MVLKKMKCPDKALWDKNFQKYQWVHFVLAAYCWPWGLSLSVVCVPRETPLEKMNFSFVSSYQLEIASRLGMVVFANFPSQYWNPICPRPVHALCTMSPPLWVHTCIVLLCPEGLVSLMSFPTLVLSIILPPAPQGSLIPEGKDLRLSVPRPLTLCILWVSVLVLTYCRRKLLWWWLSKMLIYEYSRMQLESIYSCFHLTE